jgi:hypothetical protein
VAALRPRRDGRRAARAPAPPRHAAVRLLRHALRLRRAADRELGLDWREPRAAAPLLPWRWRAYALREWTLRPDARAGPELRVRVPERVPAAPDGAEVLLRETDSGSAVAFRFASGGGDVYVLPAEALANGRITQPGHVDLLETLRTRLGAEWTFDEYRHGLAAAESGEQASALQALDLYLLHVAFAYALALAALARRFGPAWREPAVITGSTARFLTGLGSLHHRLGHHDAAAALLVRRAQEWDPRLALDAAASGRAGGETAAARLMRVASVVARAQKRGGA